MAVSIKNNRLPKAAGKRDKMNDLEKMLFNAIIGWYDNSMESYHGLEDEEFVERVCELTGMTEEYYFKLMNPGELSNKQEWLILSNNSSCDNLSIYRVIGTQDEVYKKMQALILSTVLNSIQNGNDDMEVFMDSSEMEGHIQWNDMHEEFRMLRKTDVTAIEEVDGVSEIDLTAIPEDLSWEAKKIKEIFLTGDLEDVSNLTFEKLVRLLGRGKTFEEIATAYSDKEHNEICNVECDGNCVYDDQDLYDFLEEIGAHIEDYGVEYALIKTDKEKYFEIPYKELPNRFGDDLPDETILFFENGRIYDVTDAYV